MLPFLRSSWEDFLSLFYPSLCPGCGLPLYLSESSICTKCLYKLPYTNFHADSQNAVEKLFWGRCELHSATAYLHFQKGNRTQRILHQLKYRGKRQLGYQIGKMMGNEFLRSERFAGIDWVVPVPLHPLKQRQRGYNQCDALAEGIAEAISASAKPGLLRRTQSTESQTRRSRYQRFENAQAVYCLAEQGLPAGKHILLVDDVVTTGATLEACAQVLLDAGAVVSVATIAVTK